MKHILIWAVLTFGAVLKSQTCTALYSYGANFTNVHFFNQSTVANAHYYWNFGDGTGTNHNNPIHEFTENGNYLVTLYVNDTVSNCSDYYEQWLNITKYSTDPCSPAITDSIFFDPNNYYNYQLKFLDYSLNCNSYAPLYKVGAFSGPASNIVGLPLYPRNFIATAYYFDNTNSLKRAASKTSPHNFDRSKNYQSCSANFEFSVIREDSFSQRIMFKAMNKNAYSYQWLITGFGDPIYSDKDTISILYGDNVYSLFPNLGHVVVLTVKEQNGCSDSLIQHVVVRQKASTYVGLNRLNNETFDIKLFPNPVKDKMILDFEESRISLDKLDIMNALGQTIFILDKPKAKQEIDIGFLPAGVYCLKLESKSGGHKVVKVIKE